jgi:hypothetical protein
VRGVLVELNGIEPSALEARRKVLPPCHPEEPGDEEPTTRG